MDFLTKLNRLVGLYLTSLKTILRGGVLLPFVIYGFLQFAILVILNNYTSPYIYPILAPIADFLMEEKAALLDHYPTMYLLLPYFFQWLKIAVGIIFEGLAIGLTVVLVLKVLAPRRSADLKLGFARNRWIQLALAWTLITALLWVVNWYLPTAISKELLYSPKRQMVFDLAMRLLTVGLYAIFIYVIPALIVYKDSLVGSFRTSFSLFVKNPIFTFFLALIPILLTWPISFMIKSGNVIIEKFSPELIFYLLGAGIFIDFIVNCLLTIAVVNYLLDESD